MNNQNDNNEIKDVSSGDDLVYNVNVHEDSEHNENSSGDSSQEYKEEQMGELNKSVCEGEQPKKTYYTEHYSQKPKSKTLTLKQIIAVSICSGLLGGILVGVISLFAGPRIQPYFNEKFPTNLAEQNYMGATTNELRYKNIEIEKLDWPVEAIAEKVGPAVVGIKVTARVTNSWPFGNTTSFPQGSGIILTEDGYIMTNNHVIEDALMSRSNELREGSKIEIILPMQEDKFYEARVVGRDEKTDLAVLKIEASGLPIVEMGNSDEVRVGQMAIAIGNPGGLEYMGSVTAGIISGLNRSVPLGDGKEMYLIQTDAAINPGNSGGALVNSEGKLIGVNTAKIGGSGYEGLGFAIPVNKAKEITSNLIEFNYVRGRPLIGISVDTRFNETMARRHNVPVGILVSDVAPLSGAFRAGIQRGDIITKFAGEKVTDIRELNSIRDQYKPGDILKVEIYRDGENITLDLELSEDKGN